MLYNQPLVASDAEIYTALQNQKELLIISDGGLKDSFVTYGRKIVSPELRTLFEGSGPVDGPMTQSSSTRAELFGLGSPLAFLQDYSLYYRALIRGKLKWRCDSKAALA